jgi:hypothetical protein
MVVNSESRGGRTISLIIVHTNEGDNKPDDIGNDHTAEDLGRWMDRECAAGRGKSYHKIVDDDSTVTMVPDSQAAWAALAANRLSLNICLTGWAHWSRTEWLQHRSMLDRAGGEVRQWAHLHGIPLVKLGPTQVGANHRGVCGHGDWSIGKRDGTHTDPGPSFPWDILLGIAKPELVGATTQEDTVHVDLPATLPAGEGKPGPAWIPTERIIAVRDSVVVMFGGRGAWLQAVWWRPKDRPVQHIVTPDRGIYVGQFEPQRWEAPTGAEFLVIRYAAPGGGALRM